MPQSVLAPRAQSYHQHPSPVERRNTIERELERLLLALSWSDQRTRQLRKDVQQRKNKAVPTVASMIDSALTKKEESKVRAIANMLSAFCAASAGRVCRCFQLLFPAETREDGELNNVQALVATGDRSPQTLQRLIEELDDSIAIHTEMKEWAIQELFVAQGGRS
jgi:hypothetical protein